MSAFGVGARDGSTYLYHMGNLSDNSTYVEKQRFAGKLMHECIDNGILNCDLEELYAVEWSKGGEVISRFYPENVA